jgi:cytochrome c2
MTGTPGKRRPAGFATWGVVLVAALFVGFVAGNLTSHVRRFPFGAVNRAGDAFAEAVRSAIKSRPDGGESAEVFSVFSTFVPLEGRVVSIPSPAIAGEGGGLTSVGDNIIVLTHDGRLFAVGSDAGVSRLAIGLPTNGFEDFDALRADPRYAGYEIVPEKLRYNDVQYVDDTGRPALLLSFTRYDGEKLCYSSVLARLRVDATVDAIREWKARPEDWQIVFESSPCLPLKPTFRAIEGHTAGGRMAYAGDGEIYLTVGDYSWDGVYAPYAPTPGAPPLSQDPAADYGKVIRIDLESGAAEHITRGHRNPQGIAVDAGGTVWVVEHGPRGGDELNRIERGANYGWPLETYGTMNSGLPLSGIESQGFHDKYVRPTFAWLPSIATSSMAYVDGFHETWNGDLLVGSLRGQRLDRIRIREGRTVFAEEIRMDFRIRYVLQHSDGRIVLWNGTDNIVFLSPQRGGLGYRFAAYLLDKELDVTPEASNKVSTTLNGCMECHSLDEGDHARAPSLAKVYGTPIGSSAYAGYSQAMRAQSGTWTRGRLDEFLRDPGALVPGSPMANFGVADPEVRGTLVSLLEELATRKEIPHQFRW